MDSSTETKQISSDVSDADAAKDAAAETQYLTGIKLYSILLGVTIASFLLALDVSIVSTVSHPVDATAIDM